MRTPHDGQFPEGSSDRFSFPQDRLPELDAPQLGFLPLQPFVCSFPAGSHLTRIDNRRCILDDPWNNIVITWDLHSNSGFQPEFDGPHLAFYGLDRSLDDSIRAKAADW